MQDRLNNWVVLHLEGGIPGCKNTKRILRALRTLSTEKADRQIIGEMLSDCNYSQEWQQTGRRPGNRRGIERAAAYQHEKLVDPIRLQSYVTGSHAGSPSNLSEEDRFRLEQAMRTLSDRERECYVMAHGQGFSFGYIANLIGVSKSAVQSYVKRAQIKVSNELRDSRLIG
jgi:RNA polymerase sigma factor (sigma-70 family)